MHLQILHCICQSLILILFSSLSMLVTVAAKLCYCLQLDLLFKCRNQFINCWLMCLCVGVFRLMVVHCIVHSCGLMGQMALALWRWSKCSSIFKDSFLSTFSMMALQENLMIWYAVFTVHIRPNSCDVTLLVMSCSVTLILFLLCIYSSIWCHVIWAFNGVQLH